MNKIFSILLALIFCFGTLVSCKNEEEPQNPYTSYLFDDSNFEFWEERYSSEWWGLTHSQIPNPVKPTLQIELFGKTYTGEYCETSCRENGYILGDVYFDAENKAEFVIEPLDSENAKPKIFHFRQEISRKEEKEYNGSSSPSIKMAADIALQYTDSLKEYTLDTKDLLVAPGTNSGGYGTEYVFEKKVNDYLTTDYISIAITNRGTVERITIGQTGAFDEVEKTVDFEKVKESVSEKLELVCKEKGVDISNSIYFGGRLLKRYDERIVLVSSYWIYKIVDGEYISETFTIITPLDFEPFEINIEK